MTVIIHKYPYDQTVSLINMGVRTLEQREAALRIHKLAPERDFEEEIRKAFRS